MSTAPGHSPEVHRDGIPPLDLRPKDRQPGTDPDRRHLCGFVGLGSSGVLTQQCVSALDPDFAHYLVADTEIRQEVTASGRHFSFDGTEAVREIVDKYRDRYPLIADDALLASMAAHFPHKAVGGGGTSRSVATVRLAPALFELQKMVQTLAMGMLERLGDEREGNGLTFHLVLAEAGSTGGALLLPVASFLRHEVMVFAPNVRVSIVLHLIGSEVHQVFATTPALRERHRSNGTSLLAEIANAQDPRRMCRYYEDALRIDRIEVPLFDHVQLHGAGSGSGRYRDLRAITVEIARDFLASARSEPMMAAEIARDVDSNVAGRPDDRPELAILQGSGTVTIGIPDELGRLFVEGWVARSLETLTQPADQERVDRMTQTYGGTFKVESLLASIQNAYHEALRGHRKSSLAALHELKRPRALIEAAARLERFQTVTIPRLEAIARTLAQRQVGLIPKLVGQAVDRIADASRSIPETLKVIETIRRQIDAHLFEDRKKAEQLAARDDSGKHSTAIGEAQGARFRVSQKLKNAATTLTALEDAETSKRILESRIAALELVRATLDSALLKLGRLSDILVKELLRSEALEESLRRQLQRTSQQALSIIGASELESVLAAIGQDVVEMRGDAPGLSVPQVASTGGGTVELGDLLARLKADLQSGYNLALDRAGDLLGFRERHRLAWDFAPSIAVAARRLATSSHINALQVGAAQVPEQFLMVAGGALYEAALRVVRDDPTLGKPQVVRDDSNPRTIVLRRRRYKLPMYALPNLPGSIVALERWQTEHAGSEPSPTSVLWTSGYHIPENLEGLKPKARVKTQAVVPVQDEASLNVPSVIRGVRLDLEPNGDGHYSASSMG